MSAGFDGVCKSVLRGSLCKGETLLRGPLREAEGLLRRLSCQIDALAYDLYQPAPRLQPAGALTPAEIKIVEGAAK
jgi:hypothetical protein